MIVEGIKICSSWKMYRRVNNSNKKERVNQLINKMHHIEMSAEECIELLDPPIVTWLVTSQKYFLSWIIKSQRLRSHDCNIRSWRFNYYYTRNDASRKLFVWSVWLVTMKFSSLNHTWSYRLKKTSTCFSKASVHSTSCQH